VLFFPNGREFNSKAARFSILHYTGEELTEPLLPELSPRLYERTYFNDVPVIEYIRADLKSSQLLPQDIDQSVLAVPELFLQSNESAPSSYDFKGGDRVLILYPTNDCLRFFFSLVYYTDENLVPDQNAEIFNVMDGSVFYPDFHVNISVGTHLMAFPSLEPVDSFNLQQEDIFF
jgi:hypothetical protein